MPGAGFYYLWSFILADPKNSKVADGHRYYTRNGTKYVSVTTILQATPKPALLPWGVKLAAEFAIGNIDDMVKLVLAGKKDDAIKQIKNVHNWERERAAFLGTQAHELTEAFDRDEAIDKDKLYHNILWFLEEWQRPDEALATVYLDTLMQYYDTYKRFTEEFKPEHILVESTVYSNGFQYAGTMDRCSKIGGKSYLLDIKTGKSIHPDSVSLQLAAYRYADFIDHAEGEISVPNVEGGVVLHLRPEGYKLVPIQCDRTIFDRFLTCRDMYLWHTQESKKVLGMPLQPQEVFG